MNGTAGNPTLTPAVNMPASPVFLIVEFCLLFFLLVGNSTVCWIIYRNENLRNKANVFVAVLAGTDLCFGVFTLPLCVAAFFVSWQHDPVWCAFSGVINTVFPSAANVTLCFVSIDRLVFIRKPMGYPDLCKPSRSAFGLLYICLHALLFATLPPLWGWGRYINNPALRTCILDLSTSSHAFALVVLLYGYLLPAFTMLGCYYCVFRTARLHALRVRSEAVSVQATTVRCVLRDTRRGFRRTSKTLILMILLHNICWTPTLVIHFKSIGSSVPGDDLPNSTAVYVSWLFILINTSIEPWIYGSYNHTFRKLVRNVVTCCHIKRKKENRCVRSMCRKRTRRYQVSPFM